MTPLAAHGHAFGDLGPWGWTAVVVAGLVTVWVIYRSVVLTLRPGETEPDHIKRSILVDDEAPARLAAGRGDARTPSGGR